jgi:NtrC-family two-component system sensor histidine kinase KinB
LKLRTKLLVAQAPVLLALVVVVGLALFTVHVVGRAPASIVRENFRSFDAGRGMLVAIDAIDREVADAALHREPPDPSVVRAQVAAFEWELALQASNITELGEPEATAELRTTWDAYERGLTSATTREGASAHAERARELARAVDAILRINRDALRTKSEAAAAEASELAAALLAVVIASALLAVVITGLSLRRLLSPLRTMDDAMRRLAAGDFEARIRIDGDDEVAVLARSVDVMAQRIDAYRKSSLGELLRANNRLESVMDSLPDAVLVYDLDGRVIGHNRVAADLLGVDRLAFEVLPEGLSDAVRAAFDRVRADGEAVATTSLAHAVEVQSARGPCSVLVGATPVRGAWGAMEGVTVDLRDVTKTRRLEGFRADLVAAAAHELKTPLTSLRMAVHLCLEGAAGPSTARQTEMLTAASHDCERLERVIDEMLEMATLESDSVRLEPQVVPIRRLVEDAAARHEADARRHGVVLTCTSEDAELTVSVDLERVRHVFDNVIENAIKYGGEGGRVEIGYAEEATGVRVFVDDAGFGVPADMRERVFAKFVRVPGTGKRGSGLGLNVARDVVAAHGGTVGIDDSPLGGARVWFVLPRGP